MAKVTSFLVCESIENIPSPIGGLTTQLIGPTIALRPINIPSNYSFAITFTVQGIDSSRSVSIGVIIKDPDGITVQDTGGQELHIPDFSNDSMPIEYGGAIVNLDAKNVVLNKEGCYKIVIYEKGGVPIYEHNLPVYKGVTRDEISSSRQ